LLLQLTLSHAAIGVLACAAVGVMLAVLLPEIYLRNRERALVAMGHGLAARVAPTLAQGSAIRGLLIGSTEVGSIAIADVQGRVVESLSPGGRGGRGLGLRRRMGAGWSGLAGIDTLWQSRWSEVLSGQVVQGRIAVPEEGAVFVAAIPVEHEGRVIGAMVLYAYLAELRVAATALLPLILSASIVAAAAATLAGLWASARMARPLRRMTEVAEQISQGDLSLTVEAPPWKEGEALARALNHMTGSLATQEKARRQFVADASHQLRAPLTSLQAQAEALLDGVVQDAETREQFLTRIVEEVKGLSALAQELLDLERIEAGPHAPRPEAIDLSEMLNEVAAAFSAADSAPLSVEVPIQVARAFADRSEVRQALANLVSNALEHSPSGRGVRLIVQQVGGMVRVSVADQGIGLSQEHLSLVWEPFYRVPGATTRGSGLGLAIVKRLTERQGGRVGVDSRLNEGSTFWFDLPVAE
jgi:signal transduction histidine kinase